MMFRFAWILLILLVLLFVQDCRSVQQFPPSELEALRDLYDSTQGDNWVWDKHYEQGNPWNFSQPTPNPCTQSWQGVTCTSNCIFTTCHVSGLQLPGLGLHGQLSNTLDQLTYLQSLEISSSYDLVGSIPTTLGNIKTLKTLRLWKNNLSGTIPASLAGLSNLEVMWLSNNQLHSTIPFELFCMDQLQELKLQYNRLHGQIEMNVCNLSTVLADVDVSVNRLNGTLPQFWFSMPSITSFIAQANNFMGTIPTTIRNWQNAKYIDFSANSIEGTIPNTICTLRSLQTLRLMNNAFRGQIPLCMNDLQSLEFLYLSHNYFSGTIPQSLSSLSIVKEVYLDNNRFEGTIPDDIDGFPSCKVLELSGNQLTGTIPSSMGNMVNLTKLSLADNQLTGTIPIELMQCNNMSKLILYKNNLKGRIPNEIGNFHRLLSLEIQGNWLTGTVPVSLANCSALRHLKLSSNYLHGTIPDIFHKMGNLEAFQIHSNKLKGTIPLSLYSCEKLQTLLLADNRLSGTLSPDINNFRVLSELSVANNQMVGSIPNEITQVDNLQILELQHNEFTGTIPHAIGSLHRLENLTIANTHIKGGIPNSIAYLRKLVYLSLSDNHLNGSLPLKIGNMTKLSRFLASNNHLTGRIPVSLAECRKMEILDLSQNELTGSIPNNLTANSAIFLQNNLLTGNIPNELFSGSKLKTIFLQINLLSGTFPSNLSRSAYLETINVGDNKLTGPIPESISKLEALTDLYIMYNHIDGSLPSQLYSVRTLTRFYGFNNQITGTISGLISSLQQLQELYLYENFMIGQLPQVLFDILSLNAIYLYSNYFHGKLLLADNALLSTKLIQFYLNDNMLSGSLSPSIGNITNLRAFNLSSNYMSGYLPSTFERLQYLDSVDISYNQFNGKLSDVFNKNNRLRLLFANNNNFHGLIQNVFNSTKQKLLNYIDVSSNELSGSLSSEMFYGQNISAFAAVKNCIQGTIPDTICGNRGLFSLALDGLHSAEACQVKLLPMLSAYVLDNTISGSIPSCLFEMPVLQTLHISGNGIRGSLPSDIRISKRLTDLSLSHNSLTGSIPTVIQNHNWVNLDLSFNKLYGHLDSSFASSSPNNSMVLALEVNHISGRIPSSLLDLDNINILTGNLFECKAISSDRDEYLPEHDENYGGYQCGSNKVNSPLFLWLILVFLIAIITIVCWYGFNRRNTKLAASSNKEITWWEKGKLWWSVFSTSSELSSFSSFLVDVRRMCGIWTSFALFGFLPLFAAFHAYFSTYENTYGWVVSLAFVSGEIPAAIIGVTFFIVIVMVDRMIGNITESTKEIFELNQRRTSVHQKNTNIETMALEDETNSSFNKDNKADSVSISINQMSFKGVLISLMDILCGNCSNKMKFTFWIIFIHIFNAIVVIAVNVLYVYSTIVVGNPLVMRIIAFLITMFKIYWSFIVTSKYFGNVSHRTQEEYVRSALKFKQQGHVDEYENAVRRYRKFFSQTMIWMSIFNSVIAPCLAVVLVSPQCYYYVIQKPPEVSVSYSFFQCGGLYYNTIQDSYVCLGSYIASRTTSYTPAFDYSHQCSSSLLESFANIYLLRYLFTGIALPIGTIAIKYAHEYLYQRKIFYPLLKSGEGAVSIVDKWLVLAEYIALILPRSARMIDMNDFNPVVLESQSIVAIVNPVFQNSSNMEKSPSVSETNGSTWSSTLTIQSHVSKLLDYFDKQKNVFVARRFCNILVGDLAICLTFGIIYPPLALVIFVSIVSNTVLVQLLLGRFLMLSQPFVKLMRCRDAVQKEATLVGYLITLSLPPVVTFAVLFWSFFIFDILNVTLRRGFTVWVLLVSAIVLISLKFISNAYNHVSILSMLRYAFMRIYKKQSAESRTGMDHFENDQL